jgi:methyl-accepting chemotaxis protein
MNEQAEIKFNVADMEKIVAERNSLMYEYFLTKDVRLIKRVADSNEQLLSLLKQTKPRLEDPIDIQMVDTILQLNDHYMTQANDTIALSKESFDRAQLALNSRVLPYGKEILSQSEQLVQSQTKQMEQKMTEIQQFSKRSLLVSTAVSIVCFIISMSVALWMARRISNPILRLTKQVKRMATGDLTVQQAEVHSKDEVGELSRSFHQMAQNLLSLVHQVRESSEQVAATAEKVNVGAEQTSEITENIALAMEELTNTSFHQSSGAEEVSAAVVNISRHIQHVSNHAELTSTLSGDALKRAQEGNETMKQTMGQMNQIEGIMFKLSESIENMSRRSKEIDHITKTINDISSQTNLLALNAAIEAARAGTAGNGFAVVADEVRKLAVQSSSASQQIAELITHIQQQTHDAVQEMKLGTEEMNKGVHQAAEAGHLFQQIQQYIQDVADSIKEVSHQSKQIAHNTDQLNQSVQTMNEMSAAVAANTQTTSASTEEQLASMEEMSCSASSLSAMASQLQATVKKFII